LTWRIGKDGVSNKINNIRKKFVKT
jgi:hypothetical protein